MTRPGSFIPANGEFLLREAWLAYRPAHIAIEDANRAFVPAFAEIHRRCTSMDIGINRYGSDRPAWRGHNQPPAA